MDGHDHFTAWVSIPAVIGWIAYGLCWLLDPRIAGDQSPIEWAGYAVGGYYIIAAMIAAGPVFLL